MQELWLKSIGRFKNGNRKILSLCVRRPGPRQFLGGPQTCFASLEDPQTVEMSWWTLMPRCSCNFAGPYHALSGECKWASGEGGHGRQGGRPHSGRTKCWGSAIPTNLSPNLFDICQCHKYLIRTLHCKGRTLWTLQGRSKGISVIRINNVLEFSRKNLWGRPIGSRRSSGSAGWSALFSNNWFYMSKLIVNWVSLLHSELSACNGPAWRGPRMGVVGWWPRL